MKKFTMLGASLVMLLVATACMSSATKNVKTEAGTGTAKISAIGEVSTFQSDIVAVVSNSGLIAGEKMNIPTTTLVSSSAKNEAATEIKTGYAMEVAGIMPDETVLVSNSNKKYEIQNSNNCNCATCAAMARNTLVNMGGNSA